MTILPTISDHAIIRWLERVEGYDIDSLRAQLARAAAIGIHHRAKAVVIGAGKLVINETNTGVVTVLARRSMRNDLLGRIIVEIDDQPTFVRRPRRRRHRR